MAVANNEQELVSKNKKKTVNKEIDTGMVGNRQASLACSYF